MLAAGGDTCKDAFVKTKRMSVQSWQTKLLDKWREESCKTPQQRKADIEAEAARIEAAEECFYAKFPHLRPTTERLAALHAGKCAHCSRCTREHVGHFYCSHVCAGTVLAASLL